MDNKFFVEQYMVRAKLCVENNRPNMLWIKSILKLRINIDEPFLYGYAITDHEDYSYLSDGIKRP